MVNATFFLETLFEELVVEIKIFYNKMCFLYHVLSKFYTDVLFELQDFEKSAENVILTYQCWVTADFSVYNCVLRTSWWKGNGL